jgi:hypothetical protein
MLLPFFPSSLSHLKKKNRANSGAANKQFLKCRTFYLKTGFWYQDATM